jgi:hypothetical protein
MVLCQNGMALFSCAWEYDYSELLNHSSMGLKIALKLIRFNLIPYPLYRLKKQNLRKLKNQKGVYKSEGGCWHIRVRYERVPTLGLALFD